MQDQRAGYRLATLLCSAQGDVIRPEARGARLEIRIREMPTLAGADAQYHFAIERAEFGKARLVGSMMLDCHPEAASPRDRTSMPRGHFPKERGLVLVEVDPDDFLPTFDFDQPGCFKTLMIVEKRMKGGELRHNSPACAILSEMPLEIAMQFGARLLAARARDWSSKRV